MRIFYNAALTHACNHAHRIKEQDFDLQSLTLLIHALSRVYSPEKIQGDRPQQARHVRQEQPQPEDSQDEEMYHALFTHLSNLCLEIPQSDMDVQAVGSIISSLLKVNVSSDAVVDYLAETFVVLISQKATAASGDAAVRSRPATPGAASPLALHSEGDGLIASVVSGRTCDAGIVQSLVLIVTGFAKAERVPAQRTLSALINAIIETDGAVWTGQSFSIMLNGLARLVELGLAPRKEVDKVFDFVSRMIRSIEIYMWEGIYDAQNVAIICNAMARIDYKDPGLLLHLSLIVQQMHPDLFDVQAVSNIVNAYVKLEAGTYLRIPTPCCSYVVGTYITHLHHTYTYLHRPRGEPLLARLHVSGRSVLRRRRGVFAAGHLQHRQRLRQGGHGGGGAASVRAHGACGAAGAPRGVQRTGSGKYSQRLCQSFAPAAAV
jgi:hypothetical protein